MVRSYSSVAVVTSLSSPINAAVTSFAVGSVTGFPITYPYTLSIDADSVNKELVEVTAAAGTTLTVTRGIDGTSATSHTLGAVVSHDHSARDFRESRAHEIATTGTHGVAGAIVGTTDTQVLSNKDLSAGTNVFPPSLATDAEVGTAVTVGIAGEVTNRNAAIAAAISGLQPAATAVTLAGSQNLTNKTLTTPGISDPVIVRGGTKIQGAYHLTNFSFLAALSPVPDVNDLATISGVGAGVYTFTGGVWKALATEKYVDDRGVDQASGARWGTTYDPAIHAFKTYSQSITQTPDANGDVSLVADLASLFAGVGAITICPGETALPYMAGKYRIDTNALTARLYGGFGSTLTAASGVQRIDTIIHGWVVR